jgi:hypothetical protein
MVLDDLFHFLTNLFMIWITIHAIFMMFNSTIRQDQSGESMNTQRDRINESIERVDDWMDRSDSLHSGEGYDFALNCGAGRWFRANIQGVHKFVLPFALPILEKCNCFVFTWCSTSPHAWSSTFACLPRIERHLAVLRGRLQWKFQWSPWLSALWVWWNESPLAIPYESEPNLHLFKIWRSSNSADNKRTKGSPKKNKNDGDLPHIQGVQLTH